MQKDTNREQEMRNMREIKFFTLKMIAEHYGISRQRVHQILGNTGRTSQMIKKKYGKENNATQDTDRTQ